MKKYYFLLLILGLFACSEKSPEPTVQEPVLVTESDKLNKWLEKRYDEKLHFSPVELTAQGSKHRYDEIDDFSLSAKHQQLKWLAATVRILQSDFEYAKLNDEAKTSYDTWVYNYGIEKEGARFWEHDYLFEQMAGVHAFLPTFLMNYHKVESEADMQAYIARISGIAKAYRQFLTRTEVAAEKNIRPPRFTYDIVIEQTQKLLTGTPFDTTGNPAPLWADAETKVAALVDSKQLSRGAADLLLADVKVALLNEFQPAAQSIIVFLLGDKKNASESPQGVRALVDGEAFYAHQLKKITSTELTAEAIHQLGLSEVERLRSEMVALKETAGFKGSLSEFFVLLRDSKDDERFYYPNTDEGRQAYLDRATAVVNNIKRELPNYFGLLPKADVVVKRVEAFREQDGAPQHYYPSSPDGTRPGAFYTHLSDMSAMAKNMLEVVAYHEALPGHHMQIAIAQELEGIPKFRRQADYEKTTAYVEGWALYTEYLAKEMPNTYQDVYSDFGRLTTEMWRAIRLVLDTGIHAKGWSEQQAIDYFAANSPQPIAKIRAEVNRYFVLPGQATAYKIGMIEILRLRKQAKVRLGDKFEIKGFHDTVLGGGALPLNLLERRVDKWVEAQL